MRLNFLVLNFYNYTQSGTMHAYHFLDRQYSNSHTIGKFCLLTVVGINLTLGGLNFSVAGRRVTGWMASGLLGEVCGLIWKGRIANEKVLISYFAALQANVLTRIQFRCFLQRHCTSSLQDILLVVQNFTTASRSRMYASIRKSSVLFLSLFIYAVTLWSA